LPSATTDFHDWMEYYNMPLQNCAIAAMQLPESPHLEQRVFIVLLRHKRDPSQPVWNKFEVVNIGMYHLSEVPHVEICSYDQSCAGGRIQLGASLFGVVRSVFLVCLGEDGQIPHTVNVRELSIDHEMARARPLREDWWLLLREYINTGAKMRFCCGKIPTPGFEDICCCGGWVHDTEKRVNWRLLIVTASLHAHYRRRFRSSALCSSIRADHPCTAHS
ncbi:hypothetical protein B0H13DRAFT_1597845, partial [Mycena leptocephala]